ncbi:MAG: type II toxin-antitoxin system RelE/ParE family toxin [Candidatus Marinimicrobia bacterium]|nr:type II toxin-antitoxin system RelE/ParE family toxin [Candidatus Neomarinimicrobiota bacterium]
MKVRFKHAFLKDFEKLPNEYKQRIEQIVFHEVPKLETLQNIKSMRKIKKDKNYFRIRVGHYRIGFQDRDGVLIFMRVLHRQ